MAVQNKYVDTTNRAANGAMIYPQKALSSVGVEAKLIFVTFEVAAADDDTSVFRLATLVNSAVLQDIAVACDAITAGTDWDLGLYRPLYMDGLEVDKDVFMDGQSLASAVDFGYATALDGMDNVNIDSYGKALWEHAGHSITAIPVTALPEYDIAYTANTIGTAAGTVSTRILYGTP